MSIAHSSNVLTRWYGGGGLHSPQAVTPTNTHRRHHLDPINLANADGMLWNSGLTATECFDVEFLVVNQHNAFITVTIGVDLNGGGALAAGEYWMFNEVVPFPGDSAWRGPFAILGDDDIRGLCTTGANLGVVHWRIVRNW